MADHDDPQTINQAVAELENRVRHLHAEGRLSYDPTGDRWYADGQPVEDIVGFTIDRLAVAGQLRPLAAVPAPSHEGATPPPVSPIPDQAVPRAAFEAACADAGVHPLSDAAQVIHNALSAALPYLSTQDDTAAREGEGEFAGFYITADDGYPALTYYPHADEDGVHVRSADAGTSLDELVRAARRHAASRRGER